MKSSLTVSQTLSSVNMFTNLRHDLKSDKFHRTVPDDTDTDYMAKTLLYNQTEQTDTLE
jgi:hypothetical protein